jgi:hypothetical protein
MTSPALVGRGRDFARFGWARWGEVSRNRSNGPSFPGVDFARFGWARSGEVSPICSYLRTSPTSPVPKGTAWAKSLKPGRKKRPDAKPEADATA